MKRTLLIFGYSPSGMFKAVREYLKDQNGWSGGDKYDGLKYNNLTYAFSKEIEVNDQNTVAIAEQAKISEWGMYVAILNEDETQWRLLESSEWKPITKLTINNANKIAKESARTAVSSIESDIMAIAFLQQRYFTNTVRGRNGIRDDAKPYRDYRGKKGWSDKPQEEMTYRKLTPDESVGFGVDEMFPKTAYEKIIEEVGSGTHTNRSYAEDTINILFLVNTKTNKTIAIRKNHSSSYDIFESKDSPESVVLKDTRVNLVEYVVDEVITAGSKTISRIFNLPVPAFGYADLRFENCEVFARIGYPTLNNASFDSCKLDIGQMTLYGMSYFNKCDFSNVGTIHSYGKTVFSNSVVEISSLHIYLGDGNDFEANDCKFGKATIVAYSDKELPAKFTKCIFQNNYTINLSDKAYFLFNKCQLNPMAVPFNFGQSKTQYPCVFIDSFVLHYISGKPVRVVGDAKGSTYLLKGLDTDADFSQARNAIIRALNCTHGGIFVPPQDAVIIEEVEKFLPSKEMDDKQRHIFFSGLNKYEVTTFMGTSIRRNDNDKPETWDWTGWWDSFIDKVMSPIDLSFINPPKDYPTIKKYALRWFKFRKLFPKGVV